MAYVTVGELEYKDVFDTGEERLIGEVVGTHPMSDGTVMLVAIVPADTVVRLTAAATLEECRERKV